MQLDGQAHQVRNREGELFVHRVEHHKHSVGIWIEIGTNRVRNAHHDHSWNLAGARVVECQPVLHLLSRLQPEQRRAGTNL